MNWVGGVRNRLRCTLQNDRNVQKEHFETKQLQRITSASASRQDETLKANKSKRPRISQDVLAFKLQSKINKTNDETVEKIVPNLRVVKLGQVRQTKLNKKGANVKKTGRFESIHLPPSPIEAPSVLDLTCSPLGNSHDALRNTAASFERPTDVLPKKYTTKTVHYQRPNHGINKRCGDSTHTIDLFGAPVERPVAKQKSISANETDHHYSVNSGRACRRDSCALESGSVMLDLPTGRDQVPADPAQVDGLDLTNGYHAQISDVRQGIPYINCSSPSHICSDIITQCLEYPGSDDGVCYSQPLLHISSHRANFNVLRNLSDTECYRMQNKRLVSAKPDFSVSCLPKGDIDRDVESFKVHVVTSPKYKEIESINGDEPRNIHSVQHCCHVEENITVQSTLGRGLHYPDVYSEHSHHAESGGMDTSDYSCALITESKEPRGADSRCRDTYHHLFMASCDTPSRLRHGNNHTSGYKRDTSPRTAVAEVRSPACPKNKNTLLYSEANCLSKSTCIQNLFHVNKICAMPELCRENNRNMPTSLLDMNCMNSNDNDTQPFKRFDSVEAVDLPSDDLKEAHVQISCGLDCTPASEIPETAKRGNEILTCKHYENDARARISADFKSPVLSCVRFSRSGNSHPSSSTGHEFSPYTNVNSSHPGYVCKSTCSRDDVASKHRLYSSRNLQNTHSKSALPLMTSTPREPQIKATQHLPLEQPRKSISTDRSTSQVTSADRVLSEMSILEKQRGRYKMEGGSSVASCLTQDADSTQCCAETVNRVSSSSKQTDKKSTKSCRAQNKVLYQNSAPKDTSHNTPKTTSDEKETIEISSTSNTIDTPLLFTPIQSLKSKHAEPDSRAPILETVSYKSFTHTDFLGVDEIQAADRKKVGDKILAVDNSLEPAVAGTSGSPTSTVVTSRRPATCNRASTQTTPRWVRDAACSPIQPPV